MRTTGTRRHRTKALSALTAIVLSVAPAVAGAPPYDEIRTLVNARPDQSGNGTADGTAAADAATGAISASASASGTLPAVLPLTANPGYNVSTSEAYAAVEVQIDVPPGYYEVWATFENLTATSESRDDDPRTPAHGAMAQVGLSAVAYPRDACCTPGDLVGDIFGADEVCSRPNQPVCNPSPSITLAVPARLPSGEDWTLVVRAGLLLDAIAQGATSAEVTASGRVTDIRLVGYPWEPVAHGTDWTLRTLRAGPQGARGTTATLGFLKPGPGPNMVGFGFGSDVRSADMIVIPIGGGSERITTTADAGAVDISLDPPRAPFERIGFTAFWNFTLDPGETAALLIYAAGGHMPDVANIALYVESGSVEDSASRYGSGSIVLPAADPRDAGVAAGAGPAAAGRSTHREHTADGIAGGFPGVGYCGACDVEWAGPGNRSGRWTAVSSDHLAHDAIASVGAPLFSGPGGDWEWTLTGAGVASFEAELTRFPAYGAFAPVGEHWMLFT